MSTKRRSTRRLRPSVQRRRASSEANVRQVAVSGSRGSGVSTQRLTILTWGCANAKRAGAARVAIASSMHRRTDVVSMTTGGVDRVLRMVPRISRALVESNSTPDRNGET